MSDYNSLSLHPDREHLLALMDAAWNICCAFGTPKTSYEPTGYGEDASEIRHDQYVCKSKKIALEVCRNLGTMGNNTDSLSVKVNLSQLKITVFSAYWNKEEASGSLQAYRPGAWGEYLLEQGALARGVLRRQQERIQQKQEEQRRAREEAEQRRFDPIDDSGLF